MVVPAKEAYECAWGAVRKVSLPIVGGKDITRYENIDGAVDYFFDLEKNAPRYIANLNAEGYGLLHTSSSRLCSRKLFSWGHTKGAGRWQRFLTEHAGPYIEVQAGLGKTQYGCIPMAPHTSWEWTEKYGAVQIEPKLVQQSYEVLEKELTGYVRRQCEAKGPVPLEEPVDFTKKKGIVIAAGSGYGIMKNRLRKEQGERLLSVHLDYTGENKAVAFWMRYLDEGRLPSVPAMEKPLDFICDQELFDRLSESVKDADRDNWYAYYQMGIYCVWREEYEKAEQLLMRSMKLEESPWVCHALASLYILTKDTALANLYMRRGLELRKSDLSYVKEGFKLLLSGGAYRGLIDCYEGLPGELRGNTRLFYQYLLALQKEGENEKVYELLTSHSNFELDDIREGEDALGELYRDVVTALYGECKEIPEQYGFNVTKTSEKSLSGVQP